MDEIPPAEIQEMDTKTLRKTYASGWMELTKNPSVPLIIDALLDTTHGREFNKSELARKTGVNRETVSTHLDILLELGILKEVSETAPTRYRYEADAPVPLAVANLNRVVNEVRGGHSNISKAETITSTEEFKIDIPPVNPDPRDLTTSFSIAD